MVSVVTVLVLFTTDDLQFLAVFFVLLIALQIRMIVLARQHQHRPTSGSVTLVRSLLDASRPLEAASEGSRRFESVRDPALAVLVARAAVRLGQHDVAMAWLQAAGHAADDPSEILADLDLEPDFAELRERPAAETLRWSLGG